MKGINLFRLISSLALIILIPVVRNLVTPASQAHAPRPTPSTAPTLATPTPTGTPTPPPASPTLVNFSRTQTNSYWQTYSRSDGVQDYATDLLIDQAGRVWFGTSAGVTVFDGQTWLTYTQADGLPPGAIKDIGVDPAGHVYRPGIRV
jgi:hypothetical protein